jgi:hypothetical protein
MIEKLRHISPGPDAQYGFQNAFQRLSFAYRYDGGHGVSAIVPIGLEMPYFGGWVVMKVNALSQRLDRPLPLLSTTSIEALYSSSASRPFDWYVTVGGESHRFDPMDERTWHVTEELGVRLRFSAEKLRFIRFLGGRMGIRAESLKTVRNVRFVYEFGAGSW